MSRNCLPRGIDVYTTLNIQHVESLNDVVAQITRVRVRETVPDSIIDRADDIEIIDLTPDDLIKRLHEGKVYVPATARAGARELLLARQPDRAARAGPAPHRPAGRRPACSATCRRNAIAGPWAAGDRVLVCVDQRRSRRLARALRAPRMPTGCARPGPRSTSRRRASADLSEGAKDQLAATLRLAEQLGGEAVTLPGVRCRRGHHPLRTANNVTQIVIGKPRKPRWRELLRRRRSRTN